MRFLISVFAAPFILTSCKTSPSRSTSSALRDASYVSSETHEKFSSDDWGLDLTQYFTNLALLNSGAYDTRAKEALMKRPDTRNVTMKFKREFVFGSENILTFESFRHGYVRFQNGKILSKTDIPDATPLVIYGLAESETAGAKIEAGTRVTLGDANGEQFFPAKGDPQPAVRRYSSFYTVKVSEDRESTGINVVSHRVGTKTEALDAQITFATILTALRKENIDLYWTRR